MTWIEPKEDWEMGDVPSEGDFNRIEGNINFLRLLIPEIAEVKTMQDTTTSIAANSSLTKKVTFEQNHKIALFGGSDAGGWYGALGFCINSELGTPAPREMVISHYQLSTGDKTRVGDSSAMSLPGTDSYLFGEDIQLSISFTGKVFTCTFRNRNTSGARTLKVRANIIAI